MQTRGRREAKAGSDQAEAGAGENAGNVGNQIQVPAGNNADEIQTMNATANPLAEGGESMMELPSFGAETAEAPAVVSVGAAAQNAVQAFDMQRQSELPKIKTPTGGVAGAVTAARATGVTGDWRSHLSKDERKQQVGTLYALLKTRSTMELSQQVKERLVGIASRVEFAWFERATSKEQYLDQHSLRENFQSLAAQLKRPREDPQGGSQGQPSQGQPSQQVLVNNQGTAPGHPQQGFAQHIPVVATMMNGGYVQHPQHAQQQMVPMQGQPAAGLHANTVYSWIPNQQGYSAGIEGPILLRSNRNEGANVMMNNNMMGNGVGMSLGVAGSTGMQMYPAAQSGMIPDHSNQMHSGQLHQMVPVEGGAQGGGTGARQAHQGDTSSGQPSHSHGPALDGIIPANQSASQGTDPNLKEERKNQILKQQRWLLFLRHCAKCTAGPDECQYKQTCTLAKELWKHLIDCKDDKCSYARCAPSRVLLQHHQKCRDKACPVCMPVKQYVSKQREAYRNKGLTDEQRMRGDAQGQVETYQQPVLDLASRARREEREKELLSNEKNLGTSMVEYFTIQEIEEHLGLLRLSDAASKPPGVPGRKPMPRAETFDGLLSHEIVEESKCSLCNHGRLLFEPPAIYCYSCGVKVKRNQVYYTNPRKSEAKGQWCTSCFSAAADELILDSFAIPKRDLLKKKNNDESEEPWVACDICESWVHQVCGLFNKGQGNDNDRSFVCPLCLKGALETGKRKVPETRPQAMLTAKDLPKCRLSDVLEERMGKAMLAEKAARAKAAGVEIDEVADYPELFIRVVNNVEKKVEVAPHFAKQFCEGTGRADAYLYRQKVVLLFQKINGVDICLYCLYVQEYGDNCPAPNNRVVYLSYLDSVKYFRPENTGAAGMDVAMRTYVYHEVLLGYLEDVKKRGFCSMYIWACPPLAGDDYIFFCHPNKQKVPRSDRLREWYLNMLKRSQKEGTITYVSNMFDTFFDGGKDHRLPRPSVTDLPYFSGDYWPGEAEKHLAVKEESFSQAEGTQRTIKKKEKRILLPDGAGPGEVVLAKLAEYSDMQKMKADFIVAHMYESCSYCRVYVSGDKLWRHPNPPSKVTIKAEKCFDGISLDKPGQASKELTITRFQLCQNCYVREGGKLADGKDGMDAPGDLKPLGLPMGIKLEDLVAEECPIIPPNTDDDQDMDSEFFDTRQQYLSLCQGNHYQFDTLRRARHSSMMSLYHLHNPSEPAFTATCNVCQVEVQPGESYRCTKCPDFDMCAKCFQSSQVDRRMAHPHPLTAPSGRKFDETQMRLSREDKKRKMQQMRLLLNLVAHAASCPGCDQNHCTRVKNLYQHMNSCDKGPQRGCKPCKQIYGYILYHTKICTTSNCPVPHCSRIRSIRREHAARQEAARATAYREMMERQIAKGG